MHEHYGKSLAQTVDDVTWITDMTRLGHSLLTADTRIVKNFIEARAIEEAGAIVFILPKGNMTSEEMAERYEAHRLGIDERSLASRPAAYVVYPHVISQVLP